MATTIGTRATIEARAGRSEPSLDWRDDAKCLEYSAHVNFFPARGESLREAKAVCADCPVQQACLDYAMQWDHLSGVWGGLSERERRQLRRHRRQTPASPDADLVPR